MKSFQSEICSQIFIIKVYKYLNVIKKLNMKSAFISN